MSVSDTTVLIPAAGRVPEGVLALANIGTPAMIPVGGRPVIHWTLSNARELGLVHVVVAVPRRGMFVEDYVASVFGDSLDVKFIVPTADRGVGGTLQDLLAATTSLRALVVLGDTHFTFADAAVLASDAPFVLVSAVDDPFRWCVAEVSGDPVDPAGAAVLRLRDKDASLEGAQHALIGVYGLGDVALARRAVDEVARAAEKAGKKNIELAPILECVAAERGLRAFAAKTWLDCGNADRQAQSHRALLQARAFNELAVDPVRGTITKRSRNKDKLVDEINYLRLLPADIGVLFPRVVDFSTSWSDPFVTLEYYGYPSLAEALVYENVDPGIWEQIFRHLLDIVESTFLAHPRPLPSGALVDMLVEKTRSRSENVTGLPELRELLLGETIVHIDGKETRALGARWSEIEAAVAALEKSSHGTIIHGDLCFSNILYDLRARIAKLLDPRGSFGRAGIFGDIRYDVAKLYHSAHGGYDFIVNDLFSVESGRAADGTLSLRLRLRRQERHQEIAKRFERVFFRRFDRKEIALVTAMLFLSMPALHAEAPQRQLAMAVRGLQLLDEAFAR